MFVGLSTFLISSGTDILFPDDDSYYRILEEVVSDVAMMLFKEGPVMGLNSNDMLFE